MPSHELSERAVELTSQLVGIDSVSPSLAPGSAGEARIAGVLAERLEGAGFTVHEVPGPAGRPSLVVVHDSGRAGPTVVFNGHLDTVPVEGMTEPFHARIDGDRMFGRGTSDMKGGIAGLVVAAEELASRGTPGRLVVALVADEEDGSTGAEAVLAELDALIGRPDVCLIAEPTWLDLAAAHRGYELMRVVVEGRAAHSSQPAEGRDVMPVVSSILQAVIARDSELDAVGDDSGLGGGSIMTTVVRAGSSPFTVAARAEISVERRTLPSEPANAGLDEVHALLAALRLPDGIAVSVESVTRRSPWRAATAGSSRTLADLLADELGALRGSPPARRCFPYWMESALWEEAGVPTIVCGPAGGGLHAVDEWVDLTQLRMFPAAVVEAVDRFARA